MINYNDEYEYKGQEVCENCGHSELVRLDSGALELKCNEKNESVCSFNKCDKWISR